MGASKKQLPASDWKMLVIAGTFFEKLLFLANDKVGRFAPASTRRWVARKLYPSGGPKPRMLVVDIVGSCNLRCPSCPVGNMGIGVNPPGLMDKALFARIIEKAKSEHKVKIVALYNWTEPFLHPELAEFIRIVKSHGLVCAISTNLNKLRNIDEVLSAGLDIFRISLSGYTQEQYGVTHVRGDIERVKENMRLVRDALKRTHARTTVEVYYHKYLHNLDEVAPMRRLVEELGFTWLESWAYFMPMEKVLMTAEGQLSIEDAAFVEERLALPILAAVDAARNHKGNDRCTLLEDQIVLDHQGNVNLCCTVYDFKANRLGNFLELGEDALKQKKQGHSTCDRCTSNGLQKYATYFDIPELREKYDALARERVDGAQTKRDTVELIGAE